jgi:hypothetical protein
MVHQLDEKEYPHRAGSGTREQRNVISTRKIKANRENAHASTGPRTHAGRARSARNALRHGLSLPVSYDPIISKEVETLAREIAGPTATAKIVHLAHQVAEAQIDLRRVRQARHRFLSQLLHEQYYDSHAAARAKVKLISDLLKNAPEMPIPLGVDQFVATVPEGPDKFALILSQERKRLMALDRYERRAISRRKFAIRALDAARRRPI